MVIYQVNGPPIVTVQEQEQSSSQVNKHYSHLSFSSEQFQFVSSIDLLVSRWFEANRLPWPPPSLFTRPGHPRSVPATDSIRHLNYELCAWALVAVLEELTSSQNIRLLWVLLARKLWNLPWIQLSSMCLQSSPRLLSPTVRLQFQHPRF